MLTLLIAVVVALLFGYGATMAWNIWWGVACALVGFAAAQLSIGFWIRKKINLINTELQNIMTEAQNQINRRIQNFQRRPVGSPKAAQELLEKEQNKSIEKALEATKKFERFYKWNLLLSRQTNTMRMMFYYRLREFGKVDELLKKCFFMDPQSVAMALARKYHRHDEKIDRFFTRRIKRFKGDDCALLYAVYGWILVKQDKVDEAIKLLTAAKSKTDHPVIIDNLDRLLNGKPKHYSNAVLGDPWYGLYLEEPKIRQTRQERMF